MGAATDTLAIHDRQQPLRLEGVTRSAKGAFRGSGLGPKEVDFVEPHDAFSIMAVMSLEASGFCELGQGPRLGLEGQIRKEGRLPITTMGGLKARGHPVGASGAYQIVEAALQLWGEAGANQVDLARIGMVQSIGGSGAAVFTHLLARA
jgi:acetyl-CoA C-acetyltransferase